VDSCRSEKRILAVEIVLLATDTCHQRTTTASAPLLPSDDKRYMDVIKLLQNQAESIQRVQTSFEADHMIHLPVLDDILIQD